MIVAAVSDLHGHLPDIGAPCDLLLIAGDICPVTDHSLRTQTEFLDGPFREWLERVPARHVVGVAGNHDYLFEREPGRVPTDLPWTYLQDRETVVDGMKVYGTPWQPWFCDWAFNLYEDQLATKWELIPDDVDVLVCHGPPHGYGDLTTRGVRTGSPSLLEKILSVRPKLVVFGHIHEGRGRWTVWSEDREIILANVTIVDVRYRCVHPVARFEIA